MAIIVTATGPEKEGEMYRPPPAAVLAVSPHLDDAVLSAGGRIADLVASGIRVTIFTVFAGEPTTRYSMTARLLHRTCGLAADPVAHRRAEDRHAAQALSAAVRHGRFLDAVYRTGPDGGWLIGPRNGPRDVTPAAEERLLGEITTTIGDLIAQLRPELVLTCASFGDHVDHQHTCAAVRAAGAASAVPVELWSDIPYVTGPVTAFPEALCRRSGPHRAAPHRVTEQAWRRKLAAIARYRSQHALLWPGEDDVSAILERQAEELGRTFGATGPCELFWRPA
jgi:LmbE family N-acetylglucosaminyl deacetylase